MALSLASASLGFNGPALAPSASVRATARMETVSDLEALAVKLNPAVGYYNPTSLAEMEFWGQSQEATIGFLRQAEIKHGRVAMAAFVGYCVQSNTCFPWALTTSGIMHSDIAAAGAPPAQWDALPTAAKLQIFGAIFLLELWGETSSALEMDGQKHYMKGGKPGYYPTFNILRETIGQPPLDLFDPFKLQAKMTPEKKEKALLAEINNGRLAMIGIMGMVSASKGLIVPGLDGLGLAQYSGEVMAPFSASDNLPFINEMLAFGNGGYF